MTGQEFPAIQLPIGAALHVWRIVGDGVDPFKQPTPQDLVEPTIHKRLGKTESADQSITEIKGWFDSGDDPNQLREEMRKAVAQLIIYGVGKALYDRNAMEDRDTAFWAVGAIRAGVSAPIIRSIWSSDQIDKFANYALRTLENLYRQGNIVDPKHVVGAHIAGAKTRPREVGQDDLLRDFRVGPDTAYQAYRLTYSGIASVVDLLMELKPEMLPEFVRKVRDPLLQSFATHCVAGADPTSDFQKPLQWIDDTATTELVALAILHTMETVREMELASRPLPGSSASETSDVETMSDLISDLVSRLASLGPAKSAWWVFELLNYNSYGPNEKRSASEQVEQHCTRLLQDVVLVHWSSDVINELESGLRRAQFEPRGKPLADIAWELRDSNPERAAGISRILLDEHERRMTGAVKDAGVSSPQFPYLSGHWKHQDWLTALAEAVVIYFKDIDPMDWAIEKCRSLPLSAWDADEEWKAFYVADQVAQTQMTIGLYAVQLLADAGRSLDRSKLRAFAEKVWNHADFAHQYSGVPMNDSGVAETFAARVVAAFGEPDQKWVLKQINNPAVDPRTLWALLDQIKRQGSTAILDDASVEIRRIAALRYINPKDLNPHIAPYLADLWVLLDAPVEAAETAKVLLTYHPTFTRKSTRYPRVNRELAIPALRMLAFAADREVLADEMVETARSLYQKLWGSYTPPDEKEARRDVDNWLNQISPRENTDEERE